ncbi:MAG: hypothetical protein JWQ71_392 [Pedosphaera sp.]|nr:hypothetical protein [Pedosphaera sp.]
MKKKFLSTVFTLSILTLSIAIRPIALQAADLPAGVRGLATRAPKEMKIDGDLSEFKDAFCTPVEYFNGDLKNRAAQFFYMWDDEAFYAALRTLDQHPADNADDGHLWEGDAVEWYFDPRQDENARSTKWEPGAVHCYWTGLKGADVQGRFCLRPGYLDAIKKIGVEVAAKRTSVGMDVEFKLPWANFPGFKPKVGTVIALDSELCYSDGDKRVFRSFVYGSPLSVQQPASLGKIALVEKIEPKYWKTCAAVQTPVRCDVAWHQDTKPMVTGYMALPPNNDEIGKIVFRIIGLDGKKIAEFPGKVEVFQKEGNFQRAKAEWSYDLVTTGAYQLLGILFDKSGKELGRVAPRMVSGNMLPGY